MKCKRWYGKAKGSNLILTLGMTLSTFMVAPFAIDIPTYFAVQQQLQNAADAASLAGAAKLPYSQEEAEAAAYEMASKNLVMGESLEPSDLTYQYNGANMTVTAQKEVPTITAKLMCALLLKKPDSEESQQDQEQGAQTIQNCDSLTATAVSKATPAPRDTVLVIDTSSSMDDLGGGQPFKDVKDSAYAFLDMIVSMNSDSIDRIALVKFDKTSSLVNTFVSEEESPGLSQLKSKVSSMTLYSGSGWCTNYEAGLKVALDELAANARPNAHKTIIFFTDGEPNLPEGSTSINTCLYKKYIGQHSAAKTCTQTYTANMISKTNTQIARAKDMKVTIHTIQISDPEGGVSLETMRWMLQDDDWEPGLVDKMATDTEGKQFEAASADGDAIMAVFQKVAKLIKVKLSA